MVHQFWLEQIMIGITFKIYLISIDYGLRSKNHAVMRTPQNIQEVIETRRNNLEPVLHPLESADFPKFLQTILSPDQRLLRQRIH